MNRLKEIRINNDKTQLEIAELLNITQSAYSKIELGKRDLVEDTIVKLSNYYNVSTDYLLGLTNNKNRVK